MTATGQGVDSLTRAKGGRGSRAQGERGRNIKVERGENRPCREGQDSGRSHSGLSTCHPTSPARSRTTPHALLLRTRAEHLGLRRLAGRAKRNAHACP